MLLYSYGGGSSFLTTKTFLFSSYYLVCIFFFFFKVFLILLSSVYLLLCERIQASLLLKNGKNVLRNILLEKLICCIKISEYKEEREILQDLKNKNKIDKNGKALTLQ